MALIGIPEEVRASAKIILDYLQTVQICDQCDTDKIINDILNGMVNDEVTCCGGDTDAPEMSLAEYLESLGPEMLEKRGTWRT
jgi:hypothetical protein